MDNTIDWDILDLAVDSEFFVTINTKVRLVDIGYDPIKTKKLETTR